MNERIKELMIKSGAYDHYEVNEGVDGDELPMVKFAELIVRECADVCSNVLDYHGILEKFGLEDDTKFGVES